MENRTAAVIIIALCVLSIIVGINTSLKQPTLRDSELSADKAKIKQLFSHLGSNKIAYITLEGPISSAQSRNLIGDLYSAESVQNAIKQASEDKTVKAILLRVNSPGGTVAMSQEIYNSVIRAKKEKPVIVSMGDVAASGGYYIASAADRILASPGTLTGSIGVIFNTMEVSSLANKLGVSSNVIKSGQFKDTGSAYRKMTPKERLLLQNIIDDAYSQFVDAIINGRVDRNDDYKAPKTELSKETLKKYADGRIFTGQQAIGFGFVDELGGLFEAHKTATQMAIKKFKLKEGTELPLVSYNRPSGISNFFLGLSESISPKKEIESMIPFSARHHHKILYMWE